MVSACNERMDVLVRPPFAIANDARAHEQIDPRTYRSIRIYLHHRMTVRYATATQTLFTQHGILVNWETVSLFFLFAAGQIEHSKSRFWKF